MKIALCQMNIKWEDKEFNQVRAEHFIEEAAEQAVELILFPEMSLTGFSMEIDHTKEKKKETIGFFSNCANKHKIHIGFGWTKASEEEGKAQNQYTIVSPRDEILLDYTKIHPFSFAKEDQCFISGNEIKTCRIAEFDLSTFTCYDLRFPEVFQAISYQVDLIIVPANWPQERRLHWQCLLKARAIENQVYILGINAVGEIGGLKYSGDSCVIDPLGNVLKELSFEEGLIICDLRNDVKKYREAFPVKQDRRAELYRQLI